MGWGLRILKIGLPLKDGGAVLPTSGTLDLDAINFKIPTNNATNNQSHVKTVLQKINIEFLLNKANIPDIETGAYIAKTLHVNAIINDLQNITSQIEVRLHVPMSTIEANLFLRRPIGKCQRCRNALKQVLIETPEEGEIDLNEPMPVAPPENRINRRCNIISQHR